MHFFIGGIIINFILLCSLRNNSTEEYLDSMSKKTKGNIKGPANLPDNGKIAKKKKNIVTHILNFILDVLFLAIIVLGLVKADIFNVLLSAFSLSSTEYSTYADIESAFTKLSDLSAEEIKKREPVYVVDINEYVAPKPDPSKFDKAFENYKDDTIEVHYYKEWMHQSWFHFVDVKIKHPSQLRLALAFDKYSSARWLRKLPTTLSADVNAVCAVNGAFYNIRWGGTLIYKRQLLQHHPFGVDILLIDSDGNFHVIDDSELESSGVLEQYDIVSGVAFGPKLVEDGQELTITKRNWEPGTYEPRTAICQFSDDLHYLIVLAEGRNRSSLGVLLQTFAHEIAQKNVKIAYNLDGGQSGTVIIGNRLKNTVGWGPQKPESDIIYFATAIKDK